MRFHGEAAVTPTESALVVLDAGKRQVAKGWELGDVSECMEQEPGPDIKLCAL